MEKVFTVQQFNGVLAIMHILSLVDMITNTKFSNCPNAFQNWWGSAVKYAYIVSIEIRLKAIHHVQYRENLRFLLPPLILRLYTGAV